MDGLHRQARSGPLVMDATSATAIRGKMVRQRDAWTRARETRSRPRTPAPTNGWVLAELAQLTGLSPTTIRYYGQQQLIRPLELRGTLTRYGRHELLVLLGIVRLKTEGESTLAQKKRKLDAMGHEELERWLRSGPLPLAAAAALGFAASPAASTPATNPTDSTLSPETATVESAATTTSLTLDLGRATVERWERIALLPGLDLMLRSDAKESARLAAQRICDEYVVK